MSFLLDLPTGATIVATFGVVLLGLALLRWAVGGRRAPDGATSRPAEVVAGRH
jgi:hypothetical protein